MCCGSSGTNFRLRITKTANTESILRRMSVVEVDNIIAIPACAALPATAPPKAQLDAHDIDRIRLLRRCVCHALVSPRCDVDEACALIPGAPDATLQTYATALVSLIAEFGTRRIAFYPCAKDEFSDGEIWLARTLRAATDGQEAQTRGLVAWRVQPIGHRRALFLIHGLADALVAADLP